MKLVEMLHGSRLYGTHNDNSDYDYKGVALPSASQVLRGQIPKIIEKTSPNKDGEVKNLPGDVEREIYSLHYFIQLCLDGQTVAIDMLHAPKSHWELPSAYGFDFWTALVANKHRFYTRKMTALVGYARHQAAKYGIKGSRLAAVKKVRNYIQEQIDAGFLGPMSALWLGLPSGEHIHRHNAHVDHNGIALYEVCGMKLQETAKAAHYIPTLDKFISNYGDRAKLAETNQGIDWKAVSHAFRAAYQMKHILVNGGFTYPLPETRHLIDVKQGDIPYSIAGPHLESLIDEVEQLAEQSSLPDAPDSTWAYEYLERCTRSVL